MGSVDVWWRANFHGGTKVHPSPTSCTARSWLWMLRFRFWRGLLLCVLRRRDFRTCLTDAFQHLARSWPCYFVSSSLVGFGFACCSGVSDSGVPASTARRLHRGLQLRALLLLLRLLVCALPSSFSRPAFPRASHQKSEKDFRSCPRRSSPF